MSNSNNVNPEDIENTDLIPSATSQPGSLLRLRDVQALNRSFRRLAEVQEVLLDRLEKLEEEKASKSKWALPLWISFGVVFGGGIIIASFWYFKDYLKPEESSSIYVEQPDIVVEQPDNSQLYQGFDDLSAALDKIIIDNGASQRQLADLTSQLLKAEEDKNNLTQAMLDLQITHQAELADIRKEIEKSANRIEPLQTPPTAQSAAAKTPPTDTVVRLNGLLAADGYSKIQFQLANLNIEDSRLEDVVLLVWGENQVETFIEVATVEVEAHHMAHTLVMLFKDGVRRVAGGPRQDILEEGLRLEFEGVNLESWYAYLPFLQKKIGSHDLVDSVDEIRESLDELISKKGSFSYYRITQLESIDNTILRNIQINWHDNSGRIVKTIEADQLQIFIHKSGTVELQMKKGVFLVGGQRSPFSSDRFSLHLPRQNPDEWLESRVPVVSLIDE